MTHQESYCHIGGSVIDKNTKIQKGNKKCGPELFEIPQIIQHTMKTDTETAINLKTQ
jgi:hypothetical protein